MQSLGKTPLLRIGTRGSPLALWQAERVRTLLCTVHGVDAGEIAIVTVSTEGDRSQASNRPLSDFGGKGVFSKEIEDRLIAGDLDIGVHSAKDMASVLPDGLVMPVYVERADMRDAFVSSKALRFEDLPPRAVVGTSSLRRRAQLLRVRPDLKLVEFRGNLHTRLKKLAEGQADATLVAASGLERLGQSDRVASYLDPERFPPAPAQGAIGIEYRDSDRRIADLVAPLDHAETNDAVTAERAMLRVIDGSCRTPIGVVSKRVENMLHLKGELLSPDGRICHDAEIAGLAVEAVVLGARLGEKLLEMAGADFLAALKAGS